MDFCELFSVELMEIHSAASTKTEILQQLAKRMEAAQKLHSRARFEAAVWQAEEGLCVPVENGVALLHANTAAVRTPAVALFTATQSPAGWEEAVQAVFLIASNQAQQHIQTLRCLSAMLLEHTFVQALCACCDAETAWEILTKEAAVYRFPQL